MLVKLEQNRIKNYDTKMKKIISRKKIKPTNDWYNKNKPDIKTTDEKDEHAEYIDEDDLVIQEFKINEVESSDEDVEEVHEPIKVSILCLFKSNCLFRFLFAVELIHNYHSLLVK